MKANLIAKILKSNAVQKTVKFMVSNAPKILTGVSIATSVTAVGFAIKGTVLAVEIEKKRQEKIESGEIPKPEHPKWETVKAVWKCYIPCMASLTVSVGSSLYGTSISTARTAVATAACKASELAFDEYKAKVVEELGKEKESKIEQAIAKEHAEQYATQPTTLVVSPYDDYLCMEKYSGQIIRSNLNDIKDGFNRINYDLSRGRRDYISFSEYCDEFGIRNGDENRGWNVTKTGLLILKYDLGTDDKGAPILIFYTSIPPYEDYAFYG